MYIQANCPTQTERASGALGNPGEAHLVNGCYIMTVDVPDGVRCVVTFLPSHDVFYLWDAVTLTGSVDSTYDAGCGGAPGGTIRIRFALNRYLTPGIQRVGSPSTRWAMMLR